MEPELYNDRARRILGIDSFQSNPASCVVQDGNAQIVAVADTGIDDKHPDFVGRIVGRIARGRLNDTTDPAGHGTRVSGSILGDGSASGAHYRVWLPGASLFFQSLLHSQGGLGGLPT